jgi:hypothetical protein
LGYLIEGVDNSGSSNPILEVAEGADVSNGCITNEKDKLEAIHKLLNTFLTNSTLNNAYPVWPVLTPR